MGNNGRNDGRLEHTYIFDLNNSKDLLIKYIQENPFAYEMAFDLSINSLEKFEYIGGKE